jgi:hypothetical protein
VGYQNDKHGVTLLTDLPQDACSECNVDHPAYEPHDQQSLTYQFQSFIVGLLIGLYVLPKWIRLEVREKDLAIRGRKKPP